MAVQMAITSSFHDHQRELCKLSEYIEENQSLLARFMDALNCTEDNLKEKSRMCKCSFNGSHFVPEDSLAKHERVCQLVTMGMDTEEAMEFIQTTDSHLYKSEIKLDVSVLQAISSFTRQSSEVVSHDSHVTKNTLEDTEDPPQEMLQPLDPIGLIRYIKSWHLIPPLYTLLTSSTLHPVPVKSWIINNIPQHHIYSNQVGGELRLVDAIMSFVYATPTLTPNHLADSLHPLLNMNCRHFVISFWKFVSILKIQEIHRIQNNVVEELLPLSLKKKESLPSLVAEIQRMASSIQATPTTSTLIPAIPVPSDHMTCHMTTEERRTLYDYIIELSQQKIGLEKDYLNDPNLFRDDVAMVTSKKGSDENGGKSYLEVMKEMRDYRRRRQSYRAKNVHVTKKSTKQIFHDIIEARTKEIQLSLGIKDEEEGSMKEEITCNPRGGSTSSVDLADHKRRRDGRCASSSHRSRDYRSRSRSRDRRLSHRSDEDKKSRSPSVKRERSPSPSKHKRSHKHKRSRSPSKRKRSSSPNNHHSKSHSHSKSQSHSKDKSHKKHKKKI